MSSFSKEKAFRVSICSSNPPLAINNAFDKLRKSALTTVRHAEFRLHSCHIGSNKLIHDGKNLIYLLSTYTPYLQTLRLWRNDDFPWTSTSSFSLS
ncbi:unnamed protein product [Rotaria socialis]|uniref:Uncharacterized protein n=1 Tax=Rotaria socialis TaxID=392032 RepID=A0A817Q2R5_9BILA|nr:unnamed protein product [Rotaria socialis]